MNVAIFSCPFPLSCLLARFSNNRVYRSITCVNVGGGGRGPPLVLGHFQHLLNFFFSFFMYSFYNRDIIFWWLLMPMPMITMFMITSVLSASRLWCNWLFFLMNLPFGSPFTVILNPIGPPFHLLPWSSKDEKTPKHNKHTIHIT